eukprot:1372675-Amorphochlora_amoeboformis.AAC.2
MAGGVVATPILLLTMLLSLACLITAWITEPGIVPYVALEEEETPESSEEADGHTTLQRNAPKKKLYVIALNGQHYPLPMFRAKVESWGQRGSTGGGETEGEKQGGGRLGERTCMTNSIRAHLTVSWPELERLVTVDAGGAVGDVILV